MVKQCFRNYLTLTLPKNANQVYIERRLSHMNCKETPSCMSNNCPPELPPSSPFPQSSFTIQWTTSKREMYAFLFVCFVFNFVTHDSFPPREFSAISESRGMALARLPQMQQGIASPVAISCIFYLSPPLQAMFQVFYVCSIFAHSNTFF